MTNIQEEVRKLHLQLKNKDDMINSLKNFIDKNNEGMDENAVDAIYNQQELNDIMNTNNDLDGDGTSTKQEE